jgi:hypothetical protein
MQISKKRRRSLLFAALGALSLSTFSLGLTPFEPQGVSFAEEKQTEQQTAPLKAPQKQAAQKQAVAKQAAAKKAAGQNLYVPKFRIESPLKKAIFLDPKSPVVDAKQAAKPEKQVKGARDGSKKIIERPLKAVVIGVIPPALAVDPAAPIQWETTKETVVTPQAIISPLPQVNNAKTKIEGTKYFAKGAIERPLKAVFSSQPQFDLAVPDQARPTKSRALVVIPEKDLRDYSKGLVESALKVAIKPAPVPVPVPVPVPKPANRDRSKQVIEKPLEAVLNPDLVEFVQQGEQPQQVEKPAPADESKRKIEIATEKIVGEIEDTLDAPELVSKSNNSLLDSKIEPVEEKNPKVAPGLVKWHDDFEAAKKASSQSGKPVLLFQMMGQLDQRFT